MNFENISVICVEAIVYLLSYNLHDCNFNYKYQLERVLVDGGRVA